METKESVVIKVLRSPTKGGRSPNIQEYLVPLKNKKMSLLQALEDIFQTQDDTLAFRRYCCGLQFCNSCMMRVNGKNTHACMTILEAGCEYKVEPLSGHAVIRDLIVEM